MSLSPNWTIQYKQQIKKDSILTGLAIHREHLRRSFTLSWSLYVKNSLTAIDVKHSLMVNINGAHILNISLFQNSKKKKNHKKLKRLAKN